MAADRRKPRVPPDDADRSTADHDSSRDAEAQEAEQAEQAHIESLIATGQAAKPGPDGKLPPGATHEVVETKEGKRAVVRRRFSAY